MSQPSCVRCSASGAFAAAAARIPHAYARNAGATPKADDVRKRIEFLAKLAFGLHQPRDSSIHRIEYPGQADSHRRVIEISDFSVEGRENRVVPAKHVGNGKRAGKDINAAAETMIAERPARAFFVSDGIYAVEFHFASMLSPPLTFCLSFTTTCVSRGSQMSTREPKRIKPDTLAQRHLFAFAFPAYHAPRDRSGDLFEDQRPVWRMYVNNILLILARRRASAARRRTVRADRPRPRCAPPPARAARAHPRSKEKC